MVLKPGVFASLEPWAPPPQVVVAVPEVSSRQVTAASEFLILACDGIWEVLSDQQVRPKPWKRAPEPRSPGSAPSASEPGFF